MKTTGRPAAIALVALLLMGACSGDDDGDTTGPTGGTGTTGATGSTGTGGGGPTPVETATGPPGTATFEYANGELRVVLEVDGEAGTLRIDNGTGRRLARPALYVLGGSDGRRVRLEVAGSAPLPTGETSAFDVSLAGVEVDEIGAVGLVLGSADVGLFVRTA